MGERNGIAYAKAEIAAGRIGGPCENCDGSGEVGGEHDREPCPDCLGDGTRKRQLVNIAHKRTARRRHD